VLLNGNKLGCAYVCNCANLQDMAKVVLHLGAHRTATTFLQNTLRNNAEQLAAQNWRFVKGQKAHPEVFRPIAASVRGGTFSASESAAINQFFCDVGRDSRNIFISSETIFGPMIDIVRYGEFYPEPKIVAKLLREKLSNSDVRVMYCLREFGDFIESSYKFHVGNGLSQSFAHFTKQVDFQKLSWLPLLEAVSNEFGRDRLLIWTLEDFRLDVETNLRRLLGLAGIKCENITIETAAVNGSIPGDFVDPMLSFNRAIDARNIRSEKQINRLRRDIRKLFEKLPRSESAGLFDPETKKLLSDRYSQELLEISSRFGLISF
jgi:hypothetical protein